MTPLPKSATPSPTPIPPQPLIAAIRSSDLATTSHHLSLLEKNSSWPRDADGHSALHWAALNDNGFILDLVLTYATSQRPVDVRAIAPGQKYQTPLHWACVSGRIGSVLRLLAAGADISARDVKGYTPAIHAAHYGRIDVVCALAKHGGRRVVLAEDTDNHGLLEWASYYGHVGMVTYLIKVWNLDIEKVDAEGMSSLHRAAQGEHLSVVEMLLREGAELRKTTPDGKTPRDIAEMRAIDMLEKWEKGVCTRENPTGRKKKINKYGLVIFYWVLLAVSIFKVIESGGFGGGLGISFWITLCINISSHLWATFGDPGEVEKGTVQTFVKHIEECIETGKGDVELSTAAFCYTCLAPRPRRSKHSRERDRCVRRFDHECPWVNNSVGLYTHKPLLMLVISNALAEWLFIWGMMRIIMVKEVAFVIAEKPLICLIMVLHATVSVFCVVLLLTHVRLVVRGETTYEHITSIRDKRKKSDYDRGAWNNIISFLMSTGPGTGKASMDASLRQVLTSGTDTKVGFEKPIR